MQKMQCTVSCELKVNLMLFQVWFNSIEKRWSHNYKILNCVILSWVSSEQLHHFHFSTVLYQPRCNVNRASFRSNLIHKNNPTTSNLQSSLLSRFSPLYRELPLQVCMLFKCKLLAHIKAWIPLKHLDFQFLWEMTPW